MPFGGELRAGGDGDDGGRVVSEGVGSAVANEVG